MRHTRDAALKLSHVNLIQISGTHPWRAPRKGRLDCQMLLYLEVLCVPFAFLHFRSSPICNLSCYPCLAEPLQQELGHSEAHGGKP